MELSDQEKDDASIVLVYFFGLHAESWNINENVIEKIGEMLWRDSNCTKVLDLLPRPGIVDKGYVIRQLRGIARRLASADHSYDICKTAIKYGWERVVYMASEGI